MTDGRSNFNQFELKNVRSSLIWIGFGGVFASALSVTLRPDTLELSNALLAIAIIWVGLLPGIVYLHQPDAARWPFPLMPLTGLFYALFFGMPAFFTDYLIGPHDQRIQFYGRAFLESVSLEAQVLVSVGMALMFLSWIAARNIIFRSLLSFTLPERRDHRAILVLTWALAISNLAYWALPEVRALPSVGQFLQPAGFVAFAIFYLMDKRGELSRLNRAIYFLLVLPLWIGLFFATGFLTPIILLITFWLTLRFLTTATLPWKLAFVIPLLLIFVYPHIVTYRALYWTAGLDTPVYAKVVGLAKIVSQNSLEQGLNSQGGNRPFTGLVRRGSLILPFSHVVNITPEFVDYWDGATYKTLFIGWIPRFIWREKPQERWGNEFGRRFLIIGSDTYTTSINIPWITEMYANFGRTGVLLGMLLAGLFLGFFERLLNSRQAGRLEQAIGFAVIFPLFFQESNFTLMTGSLLPLALCLWLYFTIGLRVLFPWGDKSRSKPT